MANGQDFDAWYRVERTALVRFAYLLCGGQHAAEEAVAEAIARCWPKIKRGRVDDPGAYVRRAIARRLIDAGRRADVARRHASLTTDDGGRVVVSDGLDHLVLWPLVRSLPF